MAQDGEVNVRLRVTAENGGVAKSTEGLKRVGSAAKKTAAESKTAFAQANASVGGLTRALGLLRGALTGFGGVAFAASFVEGFRKIRDSFRKSNEEADRFAAAAKKAADQKAVDDLAKSYDALAKSIAAASAAREHDNEIADIELRNKRALEDANLDLAEQNELDAVDGSDPAADEARAEIRARYAERRGNLAADRERFDGVRERERLRAGADARRADAGKIEAATAEDDRLIAAARGRANEARNRAYGTNEKDNNGFWDLVGHNAKSLVTLNWGRINDTRTEAGDAERAKAAEELRAAEEEAAALTRQKEAKLAEVKRLREEAARDDAKASAMGGIVAAQEVRRQLTYRRGAAATAAAEKATDAKDRQTAEEAARLADAEKANALLTRERDDITARIDAEGLRKRAAGYAVYEAQGAYDAARLGGSRREQKDAFANLQAAQLAAENVNHAADTAINALTKSLNGVEARLKAAQSYLERQSKQQRNAWSEAPAGN